MQKPYVPSKDTDFALWVANFAALLTAAPAVFGLTNAAAIIVQGVADDFALAFAMSSNPATRTGPTIVAKDAARAVADSTIRPFASSISRSAGVTDENKTAIGVNLQTVTRTPIPAPSTAPALTLVAATHGSHRLAFRDSTTPTTKAKPFGAIGVELSRAVGIVSAIDPAQSTYIGTRTKSPADVATSASDVGKLATYFARFVTRSGPSGVSQAGPWSAPLVVGII